MANLRRGNQLSCESDEEQAIADMLTNGNEYVDSALYKLFPRRTTYQDVRKTKLTHIDDSQFEKVFKKERNGFSPVCSECSDEENGHLKMAKNQRSPKRFKTKASDQRLETVLDFPTSDIDSSSSSVSFPSPKQRSKKAQPRRNTTASNIDLSLV